MMKSISTFFHKNEKWLGPIVLFGGFVLDNLTIRQSDLFAENITMTIYFLLLASSILLWHFLDSKNRKTIRLIEVQSILFLLIQFFFGGLFSFLTVFYIKSASLFVSWPFLLVLFGGMIATEYLKKHLFQFYVQLGVLYLLVFTYCIVLGALIAREISERVFIGSGIASLIVIALYLFIFYKIVPSLLKHKQKYLIYIVGGIFVLINTFYFSGFIPPIPLVLRDSGIYQNVTKTTLGYDFTYFSNTFSFKTFKNEYKVQTNTPVYFYSSVYAPIKFQQKIIHEWQKKNSQGNWVDTSKVTFPIYGGSTQGYRGYSISTQVSKGEWRVIVKTDGGQKLGIENFIVR